MRAVKKGKYGTVQYVSENYVVRNKDLISKHVFAGNTRLVSNMVMREEKSGKMVSTEQGCYYYHADHLGSSSVVTDKDGKFYEQLEYFPYGETWVHNKATAEQESTPYKFTAKELDPETGLYYFGARYYDGKLSRWTAADPPLARGDYLPVPAISDEAKDHNSKLPGMGGVFNSINLDGYQYAGQNPVKFIDPDGEATFIIGALIGFGTSTATEIASHWNDTGHGSLATFAASAKATFSDSQSLKSIAISTGIGAATSGLSSLATTTKTASNVIQVAKNITSNAVKNSVIGGSGATVNYIAQSKSKGNPININMVADTFCEGAALSGVFSIAGDGFKVMGITKTLDMTTKAGGVGNPKVSFSNSINSLT